MAIIERDVVFQGKTASGESTIDLPITALKNIEDTAEIKENPSAKDYVPVMDSADSGQMKKMTLASVLAKTLASSGVRITGNASTEGIHDFNEVVESGMYNYSASPANKPGTLTYGIALVFNPENNSAPDGSFYITQFAIAGVNPTHFGVSATSGVYIRTSANGGETWSEWKNLSENYGIGTVIPRDSDLNAYNEPGVYHINSADVTASVQNTPVNNSGLRLEVRRIIASYNRVVQTLYTNTSVPRMFVRTQTKDDTSVWNDWYEIQMTRVDTNTVNTANGGDIL